MLDVLERLWELRKKYPGRAVIFAALILAIYPAKVFIDVLVPKAMEDPASEPAVVDAAPQPPRSPQPTAQSQEPAPCSGIVILQSGDRDPVALQMAEALKNTDVRLSPQLVNLAGWETRARDIGLAKPCAVIVHLHTFRPDFEKNPEASIEGWADAKSENTLLAGLATIQKNSPRTSFVIYSRGFDAAGSNEASIRLSHIVDRLGKDDPDLLLTYQRVVLNAEVFYWPAEIDKRGPLSDEGKSLEAVLERGVERASSSAK